MSTNLMKRLFTVDEYHKMADAGILSEKDRVELINGEIIEMPPIGSPHAGGVNRLSNILCWKLGNKAIVTVQNPIQLTNRSEPQPDVALVKFRNDFYSGSHPRPEDVLLVIEVSDSSLEIDRDTKLPAYANSLIPEVWLRNLKDDLLEIYRNPVNDRYQDVIFLHRGQTISPINFPNLVLTVEEILG